MNVISCSDYDEMSRRASHSILSELRDNPGQLLCPASGNSALGVFENLAVDYTQNPQFYKAIRIIMLDEWQGLSSDDPNSCNTFLQNHVINPLAITKERSFLFESNAPEPLKECERMKAVLNQEGPIDICILGLGKNGHLGFNEPAASLSPHCHVAPLSETSKQHAMISALVNPPQLGLTLGMADILQSKKIILLLTGDAKQRVIKELLSEKITTRLPASLLWLHPNVECYLDSQSLEV